MFRKLSPITAAGRREIAGAPLAVIPEPPAWMNPVARRKFEEVVGYLVDLRALTAGEVALVEQFAVCYARWAESEEALSNGDPGWRTVISRGGAAGSSVPTPMMLQSQRSIEQLRKLSAALGLSPTERSRLPAARVNAEDDEMDQLLRRAGA